MCRRTSINSVGKVNVRIKLGLVCVATEAIGAEIDEDGLLRADVLQISADGPTDVLLSKRARKMAGKEMPIRQIG